MKLDLPELFADPFRERTAMIARAPQALLGARVIFESNSTQVLRLVDTAYAHLPRQRLPASAPTLRIRVLLGPGAVGRTRAAPPLLESFSAPGVVAGVTGGASLVTVAPGARCALVLLSPQMLRFAYHARYELIEFALYTLAARVNELVSLHAACVGWGGQGLLLMGGSGAGKTTVALQCLLQRFRFVSEDSTLVDPRTMRAFGVASFLHVRGDSLQWVAAAAAARIRASAVITRRSGVRKFALDLRRTGHRLAGPPLALNSLVFLSAERAPGAQLRPLRRRELLARLTDSQAFAVGQPNWAVFCRQAVRLGAFELRRGAHPLDSVRCLRELLRRQR